MDCLPFDWKSTDCSFEKDDFYENIEAPKWIDFTVPPQPVDDHAWFCAGAGCVHERKKSSLQAFYQENKFFVEASKEPAHEVAPPAIPTARVRVLDNKKAARGVVSSSLSSLTALKASCAKGKVAYHTQLPSIGECKGRNVRRQETSENENPNRACKTQHGVFKKSAAFVKREFKEKKPKILTASTAAFPPLSQTQPMLEGSEATFVFGERQRPPSHAKSALTGTLRKDFTSVYASVSGAKILKTGGARTVSSCLQSTARNPHLTASSTMPLGKNTRHLNGGASIASEKIAAPKPLRVTKAAKVAVNSQACRKRSDCMEDKSMRMFTLKDKNLSVHTALPSMVLQGGVDNVMPNDIQTRDKEDSIQNTLDKFLQNLRLTSHEDAEKGASNKQKPGQMGCATSTEQHTKQAVVGESLNVEIAAEHDEGRALEQEMVQSMRCSSHRESVSTVDGSEVMALQLSGNAVPSDMSDQKASGSNYDAKAQIDQKHDPKVSDEDWQRRRGTKRKSSERNLRRKHDSRDHQHKAQMVKQFSSTANKLHLSSKEHHKKMQTSIAPFRLRTEERGALKGLVLAKKEPREPDSKDVTRHAIRMPSFGHPFRPKRSTKKLTIPKEPKFHISKTRKEGGLSSD